MQGPRVSHQSGFTLLELLVVLAIAALLVSLTAPALVNTWDAARYRMEQSTFSRWVERTSFNAFARSTALEILVSGSSLTVSDGDETLARHDFETLRFKEQRLRFNANGLPAEPQRSFEIRRKGASQQAWQALDLPQPEPARLQP